MTANDAARGRRIFESGQYAPKPETNGHNIGDLGLPEPPQGDPGPAPIDLLAGMYSAATLDRMRFDPLVEHVPGLITEGFGILAGPPKVGKSWMANSFALACAFGGDVLGAINVEPRHVLLLALEDGQRRLQYRLRHLNYSEPLPHRLHIMHEITLAAVAFVVAAFLEKHREDEQPPLILLDTLGRARQQRNRGDDPYIADYQFGVGIKKLVDAVPGAALLATHHTRKMASNDWLEMVSGTQGIAGSADYVLVLSRKRKSNEGMLSVTGRDIAENEYALKVDDGRWSIDGMDMLDAAVTVETRREQQQQDRRSDRSLEALRFINDREQPVTGPELAQHLSRVGAQCSAKVAGNLLMRLVKEQLIDRPARGVYARKK